MNKLEEAQLILKELGVPVGKKNKIIPLTFLALCGLKEVDPWNKAKKSSVTLSKGIMDFVNKNYNADYKPNTRESFRVSALNPFVEMGVALLNRDNRELAPQSSKTHYSISDQALGVIVKFGLPDWIDEAKKFRESYGSQGISNVRFLRKLNIDNYKSILNEEIELGRVNVFIGANGSGKSNILEAIAMVAASKSNDLDIEGLINRGVRVSKPSLTLSSFLKKQQNKTIAIKLTFDSNIEIATSFHPKNIKDIYTKWIDAFSDTGFEFSMEQLLEYLPETNDQQLENITVSQLFQELKNQVPLLINNRNVNNSLIADFVIYNINTSALRGLSNQSRKVPLGINGEGLDTLLSNFSKSELRILQTCKTVFEWLSKILIDKKDQLRLEGHRLGKSISILYFEDKFMKTKNNIFSAENANEGILHFLFYLALFSSSKTPKIFAIDNIETALNPKMCRLLIKEIVSISERTGKQSLITTHNPAVLDGLNLLDDEQRLFEVYRDDDGITKVRRIKFKSDLSDKTSKLSEMWMKGLLGAVPQNF
jgi:predicted ATPase